MIVAFTGYAGAGKDEAANGLGFTKLAFADALRQACVEAFGWPMEFFTDRALKDTPIPGWPVRTPHVSFEVVAYEIALHTAGRVCESDDEELFRFIAARARLVLRRVRQEPVTPRRILQVVGTDIVRHVWPTAWIELWKLEAGKHENVAVPDCRFLNEAAAFREMGGVVIRILRTGAGARSGAGHESELEIDSIKPDAVICNDGSIEDLRHMVLLTMSALQGGAR
jgi:hypothetical protein